LARRGGGGRRSEGSDVAAQRTSQKELLAVRMGYAQGAFIRAWAHGDSRFGFLGEVVSFLLACVAVVAEVRLAPAIPRRNRAAELTLPLQEILSVRRTLRCQHGSTAPTAHEVVGIKGLVVLPCITAPLAGKVGVCALRAHEVRIPIHGKLIAVVEPLARMIHEFFCFR